VAPTFVDPRHQEAFEQEGYAVVDLLDGAPLDALRALCSRLHPEPTSTWMADFFSTDPEVKRATNEAIDGAVGPAIERLLTGHRSVMHAFVLNWPGDDGGLPLHQHSTMVDERTHRSAVIWCALEDATEANGTLHVVPRSHLVPEGPRGERSPEWFAGLEDLITRDHLVSVPLRAGQAIVFDNALLHCSFPNTSDAPRRNAVATVVPTAARILYHEWNEGDVVKVFRLHPEFFLEATSADLEWARPDDLELLWTEEARIARPSPADIAEVLVAGTCAHPS
jgi:ectoine hydroxylase-related dioxygenase (phytanoyl-CoA dioxygenase family)